MGISDANLQKKGCVIRVLWSALDLVHSFKNDCKVKVGVNFFGAFGLALQAAGADFWGIGWYKSFYRFRLADKIGGGPAYPSYWSFPAALDINLDEDFDKLRAAGVLDALAEETPACKNLLEAVKKNRLASEVLPWEYRANNKDAAQDHFLYSILNSEKKLSQLPENERANFIQNDWLDRAIINKNLINSILGTDRKTKTGHVDSWHDAFILYRRDHFI